MRRAAEVLLAVAVLLAAGCAADDDPRAPDRERAKSSAAATRTDPPTSSSGSDLPTALPPRGEVRVRHLGVDASHHQGAIDWRAVADDGISFAYLKASEGTSYTDPTFAGHRAEAQDAGIRVGGYHYFQLCSPGRDQAAHFVTVLGALDGGDHLPPAVDLELAGSCSEPPPRAALLAEVEAFLHDVEAATGREPVVYLYPELEAEYGLAPALGDHRQWVRSLDGRPQRDWWIWQRTDSGLVDGIAGPVDVNVMWARERRPS